MRSLNFLILAFALPSISYASNHQLDTPEKKASYSIGVDFITRMKSQDYLAYFGQIYGLDPEHTAQRATKLLDRFGLSEALNQRLGQYSKGMRQKLAMVRALLHDPDVLLQYA